MSHEQGFKPVIESPKHVGTLEALLEVHRDMQRGRMFIHFGDPLTERLAGFIEGYRACLREYGLPDEGYSRFCQWLWKTKQEEPIEKAPERYLFSAGGDHEQAIGTYLDQISEFSTIQRSEQERFEGETSSLPSAFAARPAPSRDTLSYLLQVRQDLLQGRLREHLGDINAERFNTFVDGYIACTGDNHLKDDLYTPFRDWLRDVKREFPEEGWPAKYLRDCHGDHARAILKYLDFVSEFAIVHNLDRFRKLTQEYRQLTAKRKQESASSNARFEAICTRGRELIGQRLEALSNEMKHWRGLFGPHVPAFDFFDALGISGKENQYSDMIAWLCKPVDGRGGAFARTLLSRMRPPLLQQSQLGALLSVKREQVTHDGRIDLVLKFEKLAFAVETKVWSREHETPGAQPQTVSYPPALARKLGLAERDVRGVLLSPGGTEPLGTDAACLSFFDLAASALAILAPDMSNEEQAVIRLFAAHVLDIAAQDIAGRPFWEIERALASPHQAWPPWVILEANALERLFAKNGDSYPMSFFSKEAELFADEYAIVEAMRTAWSDDIKRFFTTLHSAVEQRLCEKLGDVKLHKKLTVGSPGSLYWWITSGAPEIGNATLWYSREYPELIRDKQVHWRAYLDIASRKAPEKIQSDWMGLVESELRKLQPGLTLTLGAADTFTPLRLVVHWKEDPIAESAGLLADALEILHRAVSKVKESQRATP